MAVGLKGGDTELARLLSALQTLDLYPLPPSSREEPDTRATQPIFIC